MIQRATFPKEVDGFDLEKISPDMGVIIIHTCLTTHVV
jgi:hypothetical protein